MKIIIASDNHYDEHTLKKIVSDHQDADYYLHCGDSQMNPKDIAPFESVRGNNDFNYYPETLIIKLNDYYQILLTHGDRFGYFDLTNKLYYLALEKECNIVAHGHTHIPYVTKENGITILNPGSTSLPRGGSKKSYAVLLIEEQQLEVIHIEL